MVDSLFAPPKPKKGGWKRLVTLLVIIGTIVVLLLSTACAPAMKQARLAQHDLTTPSMVGVAAADSTATALGYKTNRSPAEQEFLLKMERIKALRDVGVAEAQAKAAAYALLMQRYGGGYGGYGSGAMGSVTPYNNGYRVPCAPPGC